MTSVIYHGKQNDDDSHLMEIRQKEIEAIRTAVVALLKERREELGISGAQLAERAGLNQSAISLLDRELRSPTLDTLLRMAAVLEVNLGEVLIRAQAQVQKPGRVR